VEWRSLTIRRMFEKVRMSTLIMLRFQSRHPICKQNIFINCGPKFPAPVHSCNHGKKSNLKSAVFCGKAKGKSKAIPVTGLGGL
jgi:hypothetical protein